MKHSKKSASNQKEKIYLEVIKNLLSTPTYGQSFLSPIGGKILNVLDAYSKQEITLLDAMQTISSLCQKEARSIIDRTFKLSAESITETRPLKMSRGAIGVMDIAKMCGAIDSMPWPSILTSQTSKEHRGRKQGRKQRKQGCSATKYHRPTRSNAH